MNKNLLRRWVLWPLEAGAVALVFTFFRALPLAWASNIGGRLARTIGPRTGLSRRAAKNIRRALPDKNDAEVKAIIAEMWDNLGRMVAEYPNLGRLRFSGTDTKNEVVGEDVIAALREDGRPALLVGGHIANWEAAAIVFAERGVMLDRVYRMANNPLVEAVYRARQKGVTGTQIQKGRDGARLLIKSIAAGHHIGMLVDQKMNNGIAVPFFGMDAMTAPAAAELALKYDCPLVPVRTERLGGAKLRVTVYPPLDVTASGDKERDVATIMGRLNDLLESWIRERPGQWLWLHNRWPD